MISHKLIENIFFFAVLLTTAYLVWQLFSPFMGAIALAAIIVTICYPIHARLSKRVFKKSKTIGALVSVAFVMTVVIVPILLIGTLLLREAASVYSMVNSTSHTTYLNSLTTFETFVQKAIPEFSLDIASVIEKITSIVSTHLLGIFTSTASTLFFFFIALITLFYFFRDGKEIISYFVRLSPLNDGEEALIIRRVSIAIRSVVTGTLLVALIQGILTTIGLSLFGFDRAILWGSIASISALIPGVGTTVVLLPSILYLFFTGSPLAAGGLAVWAVVAVGLIDNILGPYLMSRGNTLHPFAILLSVLGGIAFFGPLGFVLGPVITSLFVVLVELYTANLSKK